ncbi:related to DUF726 domain protein [Rhynchosporium secalis]|uniref:Related to DUF726 domain protein n=1 Tax=Rhynchosporium secalis TaxID=38038 RepID=A0A1E1M0Z8_RHYSE|nr:related to DUF726 domain protein [Rhynchosporium secalis]
MPGSGQAANKDSLVSNGNVAPTAEMDDFGLPVVKHRVTMLVAPESKDENGEKSPTPGTNGYVLRKVSKIEQSIGSKKIQDETRKEEAVKDEEFKDARSTQVACGTSIPKSQEQEVEVKEPEAVAAPVAEELQKPADLDKVESKPHDAVLEDNPAEQAECAEIRLSQDTPMPVEKKLENEKEKDETTSKQEDSKEFTHIRGQSSQSGGISEWSHQHTTQLDVKSPVAEEDEWQTMPSFAPYDIYDDDNRLIAKEHNSDAEEDAYEGLGGAGKGYTRVLLDEDAQSATSLDENTQYLFKDVNGGTGAGEIEDEEQRDATSQMQATKDLLTEGQRIAYVGMTRLILSNMVTASESINHSRGSKKDIQMSAEAMKMWSQRMMVRVYAHMEISTAEQIMIEQLAEHGVVPKDLTSTLMQNARVKNPMAGEESPNPDVKSPRPDSMTSTDNNSQVSLSFRPSISSPKPSIFPKFEEEPAQPPPPYEEYDGDDLPEVRTPSQLPTTASLDIDLRWTVLCDLFLTLIADSVYDARSRVLLEKVGDNMEVSWLEICRFEKRVTDALEMQQASEKENWNEDEHKESRRKLALNKRYMMMGLATVGGGLVIGLSAGLLAPVIGAGLAAGFTTIGVAGTSGFLAGAGGAAIITSGAAASGGIIAVRAANRRTGAVKTFEYRPLHNNKRVNLIVTVSGWMTGKVDDVRLPYSTVDPIMGDIYSVLWEPEMLQSMGDTINILATEALTQGLQQVLGSTILTGLMAALTLPVVLTKLAYLIDNPWTVSLDRANMAGLILADSLIDRNLGTRPITFVGYSLGSRVIFACLKELARKGAYGLVQNVYLFGSPIVAKRDEYLKARSVVAGRFVNGYARNDWILGYLFRLTSGGISRVAGLAPVEEIPDLENVDVTDLVPGHMAYRTAMPKLLREVGWLVESDEFTEIEDPDPENHAQRQRELINEIEEARKELEKKEKEKESKGKFGFFSRKKKTAVERKEWETYEETKVEPQKARTEDGQGNNHGVLFDVDAIRAELAGEHMEVKELKSTLPPMKLDLTSSPLSPTYPRSPLRETQSYDGSGSATLKVNKFSSDVSPRKSSSEWIPAKRSPPVYAEEEEEIQMTFDTAYRSPPRSAGTSSTHLPIRIPTPLNPPTPEPTERAATLQRPELKSSSTMPATLAPPMDLGHNAWADDDDDDEFGTEKEIQMTFA